ncbi:MAG: hypothetical protein K1060chlam4_00185 [Candidatus Anoxychlamydiales bacterium]|nr:hypothetical protein [Candidatus Anoxychlamydiales bacterium]
MNIKYEKAKVKILAWSIEDTIDLFFFSSIIEEYHRYKNLEELKKSTFNFIKDVLEKDFMKAGNLLPDNTFKKWNKSIEEIIIDIKNKWNNLDRELQPHEIIWFEITEKGRKEFEYLNSLPELKETDPFYFNDK